MKVMTGLLLLLMLLWGTAGGNFLPTIVRLNLPSCNDVTLTCHVLTAHGYHVRVENSHFLADGTNIQDLLTGTEIDDSVEGEISFTLRQDLEALYKCGNDSYTSTNSIPLISCPTRIEVDRYHAVPVGQEVSLECGVKQGKLGSYYHPEWHKGVPTVDTTSPDSLYRLQREELKDFTLTFLNPSLSDSGMYSCDVEIEQESGIVPVEDGGKIELLVYEKPVITYVTEDITAIIPNGESKNVTFICNATGSPDLAVLWYHNGERVVSNEDYSIDEICTEGAVSSRLILRDPKLTDSGTMTCKAKVSFRTDAGNDDRSIETTSTETTRNIIILVLVDNIQGIIVTSGNETNLSCSAVGSEVDIEWTVDDTEYEKCSPSRGTGVCFENSYINDTATTRSTFIIADGDSLGEGSHTVQCIVKQNLDPHFGIEPFLERRTAFLLVHQSTITIVPIREDIQDTTITIGEKVNFSCSAVGSEVDIGWAVDDTEYENCALQEDTSICFEDTGDIATTRSTLIITDSSSLGAGSHTVQCVVQDEGKFLGSRTAILHIQPLTDSTLSTGTLPAIATLALPLAVFVLLLIILVVYINRRRRRHTNRRTIERELQEQGGEKSGRGDCRYEKLVRKAIPKNSIRMLKIIGEGEFGLVYKAHLVKMTPESPLHVRVPPQIVAVKTLKGFYDQERSDDLLDEALSMKNLDHPNILTLIGVCMDEHSTPWIVMPYMANGSLLVHLRTNNYVLINSQEQRLIQDISRRLLGWCLQIAQGMEYLAVKRIVHRDLAARNCMLGENMAIKIADFGFSEKLYTKAYVRMVLDGTVKLPVKWMAPESICHEVFSEKSDAWSFGVTCWEIFTGGVTPYPGVHSSAIPKMCDHERIMDRPNNQACSEDMYGVMLDCWESAADDRPSFSQLVTVLTTHLETLAGGYLKITAV